MPGRNSRCTIHQPSSAVYTGFDRVMLLSGGKVAFLVGPGTCYLPRQWVPFNALRSSGGGGKWGWRVARYGHDPCPCATRNPRKSTLQIVRLTFIAICMGDRNVH